MKTPLLALASFSVLLGACSSVSVTTDYDRSASFARYKTYSLAPAPKGRSLSPSSEAALRGTLSSGLAAKGLRETSHAKADLSVVRHVFTADKIAVHQYSDWGYGIDAWPYAYGAYRGWYGAPRTYTDVTTYTEGTLVLDFVDNRTGKLVYRGVGKGTVGGPETNANRIAEATKEITMRYPAPTQPAP